MQRRDSNQMSEGLEPHLDNRKTTGTSLTKFLEAQTNKSISEEVEQEDKSRCRDSAVSRGRFRRERESVAGGFFAW